MDYHINYVLRSIRQRARKAGLECDIDAEFLHELLAKQKNRCAVCGIPLTYLKGTGHTPTNASVDRIDPGKGYVKNNIQLVSYQVNIMKSNLSLNEFLTWCYLITKTNLPRLHLHQAAQDKIDYFDSNERRYDTTNTIDQ